MYYSKLVGKTEKQAKRDTTAISHQLLYRGGFIRQIAAGRYAYLPLGMRVWNKILNVIEEEMFEFFCLHYFGLLIANNLFINR